MSLSFSEMFSCTLENLVTSKIKNNKLPTLLSHTNAQTYLTSYYKFYFLTKTNKSTCSASICIKFDIIYLYLFIYTYWVIEEKSPLLCLAMIGYDRLAAYQKLI